MSSEFTIKRTSYDRFENDKFSVRTPSFSYKFNKPFCLKSFWINDNFFFAKIVYKKVRFDIPYPSCFKSNRKLLLRSNILERNRLLKTGIGKKNIEGYKNHHKVNIS